MHYDQKVTEYIHNAPLTQQKQLEAIRSLIHESVPRVIEELKWGFPVFRKTKDFAYVRTAKNHITLGFYNFERIPDAETILEGSGNTLRHLKIKPTATLDQALLATWLVAVAGD
jgi:hypothetical protein